MVLIIEPSEDLGRIISDALKREDILSKIAHSSQQAIKFADENEVEAVIIELLIPRHNGLEFIYEFRSYADWLDIPIIIYSQLSNEELGLGSKLKEEMGVSAHLYKPTSSLDRLVGEVKKVI